MTTHFFLSFDAPLVFAVPRNSFDLFFRCLPIKNNQCQGPIPSQSGLRNLGGERKLTLLPTRLFNLIRRPNPDQSVVWLELLQRLVRIVDEGEAGGLAATVLCPEPENHDLVFVGFVEFGELGAEFVFGDVGAVGVEDVTAKGESSQ